MQRKSLLCRRQACEVSSATALLPPSLALADASLVNADEAVVRESNKVARILPPPACHCYTSYSAAASMEEAADAETDADGFRQSQQQELEQRDYVGSRARFSIARLLAPSPQSHSHRCCGPNGKAFVNGGGAHSHGAGIGTPHLSSAALASDR